MGLRDPIEYINSLRDGRIIYYRGKKVEDVTKHEVLKSTVNHTSLIYKWQQDDEKIRELTVYKDEVYGYSSKFYKIPRLGALFTTAMIHAEGSIDHMIMKEARNWLTMLPN
ncbi:MAG: 4-hydroxyphenylacetate 3-hydroxylase N-terminal domain-containing protein [Caldisphaera sp.]